MQDVYRFPFAALAAWTLLAGTLLVLLEGSAGAAFGLLGSTGLALVAAAAAARTALVTAGSVRRAWALLGLGSLGWGLGNAYWSWNELVAQSETLFPSPADVGFLLFPAAGAVGVWLLSGRSQLGGRLTEVLDGLIVTLSLFAVFWITTLAPVVRSGAESALAYGVSLAYPLGDLVLVTMVFLLAARTRLGARPVVVLLGTTLLAMAGSDVLFATQTAAGSYVSGDLADLGWLVAFPALALAARAAAVEVVEVQADDVLPRWRLLLPYLPFTLAVVATGWHTASGGTLDGVQVGTHLLLFGLVLVRQMITLTHNSLLTDRLRHQAFHDPLTGLANRVLFSDRLEHALLRRERDSRDLAVMYLDLDDFKLVNDTLGHDAGDALLRGVAERLRACVRPCDTVARLGGDEFALLLEDGEHADVAAERLLQGLRHPFVLGTRTVAAAGSIGVARYPAGTTGALTVTQVLKDVDLAMYAAKAGGKAGFALFDPRMRDELDEEVALRADLQQALAEGALHVAYQPITDLRSGRVIGVEALARWRHETRGAVPPDVFIPVAERAGLILALGAHVLETACADAARWPQDDVYLSVNVSPTQLADTGLPGLVAATLARHRLPARRLVLEVTEEVLVDSTAVVGPLTALRDLGVRIAVDDFGSGYSSLRYLHTLPLDILKIDRSYVAGLPDDRDAAHLTRAIIALAHSLGLSTTAEGVENAEQLERLLELGCRQAQGYLMHRPLDVDALGHVLAGQPVDRRRGRSTSGPVGLGDVPGQPLGGAERVLTGSSPGAGPPSS